MQVKRVWTTNHACRESEFDCLTEGKFNHVPAREKILRVGRPAQNLEKNGNARRSEVGIVYGEAAVCLVDAVKNINTRRPYQRDMMVRNSRR